MYQYRLLLGMLASYLAFTTPVVFAAQPISEQNAQLIKPYLAPRTISTLEWELLQFNLLWQDSLEGSYVTSYPVFFDSKTVRFRATFQIRENRVYQDPEPFFSLPKVKRESIIQGAINNLVDRLATNFPEVKTNKQLLYAEFWFMLNGGHSTVAKYENGVLTFSE